MNEVLETIFERRSIRSYKNDPLPEGALETIVDAGRWAPTARNEQELITVAVTDKAMLEELNSDFSKEGFSKRFGDGFNFYYNAPALILLFGPKDFPFTDIDGGITIENMALAAQSLGLNSVIIGCLMGYLDTDAGKKWFEKFGIPDDFKFVISIAVGYKDKDTPKRDRKPDMVKYF